MINTPQLTNLQIEILELYSTELLEKELNELKIHMANFFANKAIQESDTIWEQKQLSQKDMEKWLNE